MGYINKIVVNGAEVNANQFEGILDKDGHARFIEGEGTPETISGVTVQYNKWSLSGSHLMIVYAFKIDANATLGSYAILSSIELPEWLYNKIYPLGDGTGNWVSVIQAIASDNGGLPTVEDARFLLAKSTNKINIYHISSAYTPTADRYLRVQFDLLIDNNA